MAASAAEPQWGQAGEAAARVARAASAALATARAAAGLKAAEPVESVLELCGVGRLNLPLPLPEHSAQTPRVRAAWEALPPALAEPARRQAWLRVQAALSAPRQTERSRAASWVIQAHGPAFGQALQPASGQAETAATTAALPSPAVAAAVRSLARLARNSRDATVVHWALAACSREGQPSADCRRLSARDLVRLAPDDGMNWLRVAGQAGAGTAGDAALNKALQAGRFGGATGQLAQLVDAAWPDDLPGYLRLDLLRGSLLFEAGLARPALEAAAALCSAQAMDRPGRRAQCDALARQMLAQGREGGVLDTVASLASRLAWSEADLEPLKRDEAALFQATASLLPADQPYACPVLDDTRNWVQSVAADGEVQAARRRLANKPTTARPAASRP